jgi:hypothetical protein
MSLAVLGAAGELGDGGDQSIGAMFRASALSGPGLPDNRDSNPRSRS